ncbi:MAG: HAD-IIB family hydrolase [Minisyncoccota bacterium]
MSFNQVKLIIFDLDSTLAESKSPLTSSMVDTLYKLLSIKKVAVISGGMFSQFEKQFLSSFNGDKDFKNLYLMPTSGSRFYIYKDNKWSLVYSNDFTLEEKQKIRDAFSEVFLKIDYDMPKKVYGELIEDRDSQIAFSALGQDAPLDQKNVWDPDHKKREEIVNELKKIIPEFNIQIGGTTTIDITAFGVDKASGIENIQNYLNLTDEEIIFVGDAIFPGGNDYPALKTGVECIKVENPRDTERLIKSWL